VLAPINSIVNDTLQSLSTFLTGIITDQQLLVQHISCLYSLSLLLASHTAAGKPMVAWGSTVVPATHKILSQTNPGRHLMEAAHLYAGSFTQKSTALGSVVTGPYPP